MGGQIGWGRWDEVSRWVGRQIRRLGWGEWVVRRLWVV